MIRKIREAQQREEGFTLIELLVVVIIIGILAAIAIPTFLNQRKKAWHSAAESDLRNAATAQESYYTTNDVYTTVLASLEGEGFNVGSNITLTPKSASAVGYCMEAFHNSDTATVFHFDSASGEPLSGACTTTY